MQRFDLTLAAALWRHHRGLRRHESWPRSRLPTYQATALRRLRTHAYTHSAFYRRWHAGLEDRPLAELPVLSRERLLETFDEVVTDPDLTYTDLEAHVKATRPHLLKGRYIVVSTSGTSGQPVLLAYDVHEWAWVLASLGRGTAWAGLDAGSLHRRRVASVGTTSPFHVSARAGLTLPEWWLPTLHADAAEAIDVTAAKLTAWRPDLLVTYGSLLGALAEAQLDGRMDIAPRAVVCGADTLPLAARRRAREAWGIDVFEEYAATETAGIASECEAHRGLHLYEDLIIAEPVDDDYQPVPAGESATRLLVTVLFSRTLPLIRYELPDGVRLLSEACPCGRPFRSIDGVDGRTSEALQLRTADGRPVTVNAVLIHEVMDVAGVRGWQLIQERERLRLRILVSPAGQAESYGATALRDQLAVALGRSGATVPPIDIEPVAHIERGPTGKVTLIKSLVPR